MKTLIGQQLMIGISGLSLTTDEKKFIVENHIGGVTLFGRNVSNPKQVWDLCREIQSLRHEMKEKIPLFIATDMEGGRVARLKSPFTVWPPLKKLGDLDSPTLSFRFAEAMATELRAVGINVDWAPCVDIFNNPKNTVIGDRAIGTNADLVEKHASALIRGYKKGGIIACAKHFPGHGHTIIDSHEALPIADQTLSQIEETELIPFKRAVKSRVDMIMTAHILFEKIDKNWPVTFSELFLQRILRDQLRYRGLIVTDDLGMKALSANYDLRLIPVQALIAGADILLYCNEPEAPPIAIEAIESGLVDGLIDHEKSKLSIQKILELKKEQLGQPDPMPFADAQKWIGHNDHLTLAKAIQNGVLPEDFV